MRTWTNNIFFNVRKMLKTFFKTWYPPSVCVTFWLVLKHPLHPCAYSWPNSTKFTETYKTYKTYETYLNQCALGKTRKFGLFSPYAPKVCRKFELPF